MVCETLAGGGIRTEAFVGGIIVAQQGVAYPFVVTLDAEVVITLCGKRRPAGTALQTSLN